MFSKQYHEKAQFLIRPPQAESGKLAQTINYNRILVKKKSNSSQLSLFDLWALTGGQPFKAISTYEDIEWVKIYKDPRQYGKTYGWIKMKNSGQAYNREIFYASCKCWTLIEILSSKAA